MFDMSWGEMMVIGAVALIVIGPKDLPRTLRTVGNMVGKVRRMASDFQGQFQEAMREAELDDVKRQIQGVNDSVSSLNTSFNPVQTIRDELKGAIDPKPASTAPAGTAADAAPEGRIEPGPSVPVEPAAANLTLPELPPVADPAALDAAEVQRELRDTLAEAGRPAKLDEKA
jgi:sec-independent protein translocase protein TatB